MGMKTKYSMGMKTIHKKFNNIGEMREFYRKNKIKKFLLKRKWRK